MKLIRWVLAKVILFLDAVFSPKPLPKEPQELARIREAAAGLALYQYEACPFCVKVRRFLKVHSLEIPLRDAKSQPFRDELLAGGGKLQVPCLRIEKDGQPARWLYESGDIITHLQSSLGL
jgi:glutaredoxin